MTRQSDSDDTTDDPPPEDFDYGERLDDGQFENHPTIDEGEFQQQPRDTYVHVEGCGQSTTMARDLAESVARDPGYYSKTFCAGCNGYVPVEEVEWEDGEDWVVNDD